MGSILNEGLATSSSNQDDDYEAQSSPAPPPPPPPQLEPRPGNGTDPLMVTFRIFSIITAIAALLCTAVNVISVIRCFKYRKNVFEGILGCYAVAIALFVAIAETEWSYILQFWRVLAYWVGRGMLQIFVAVMTKALSHERTDGAFKVVLSEVASGLLFACGAIYVVAGLLCVGKFKRSHEDKTHWREKAINDLEDVEKRRRELQGLLSES